MSTNLSTEAIAAIVVGVIAIALLASLIAVTVLLVQKDSISASSSTNQSSSSQVVNSSLASSSIVANSSSSIQSSASSSIVSSSSSLPVSLFYQQQGNSLVGENFIGDSNQGFSVAISGDGNTIVTGGPQDNSDTGAVWVFERTNGVWNETQKLIGTPSATDQTQGLSVAISSDGNTIAVGTPGANGVFIFIRNGASWVQQGGLLTGSGGIGTPRQGTSVALSFDGNRLASGGTGDNSFTGAVWVFSRTGTVWTEETKLVPINSISALVGISVSISSDGNTIATGGSSDNSNIGATWIFTLTSSGWSQVGSKLVGTGAIGASQQGSSVALSSDATILVVGATGDNSLRGAFWYFQNISGTWTQIEKVVSPPTASILRFGFRISFTPDGNTLVVGARGTEPVVGFAYIFVRQSNSFTYTELLAPSDADYLGSSFGFSVAINSTANTIVTGSPFEPSATPVGRTYVFTK